MFSVVLSVSVSLPSRISRNLLNAVNFSHRNFWEKIVYFL
jgi:hypothetical protein